MKKQMLKKKAIKEKKETFSLHLIGIQSDSMLGTARELIVEKNVHTHDSGFDEK